MVKCTSPGCSKEQYHIGLCEGSLDIQSKRRVEKKLLQEIKKYEPYKHKRNKLAPTYGLGRNGRPYNNPHYKFYANGDVDGDHWMCVYKPTHLIFPVPFPKPASKVPISQLVYMAFPGDNSLEVYSQDERDSDMSQETDAEERHISANMLLDLQLLSPVSNASTCSVFDSVFVGLQAKVGIQAKKRLCEHLIDPDAIFDAFHTIQFDIREQIAQLVLDDIDPNTFAYKMVDFRLNALMMH